MIRQLNINYSEPSPLANLLSLRACFPVYKKLFRLKTKASALLIHIILKITKLLNCLTVTLLLHSVALTTYLWNHKTKNSEIGGINLNIL